MLDSAVWTDKMFGVGDKIPTNWDWKGVLRHCGPPWAGRRPPCLSPDSGGLSQWPAEAVGRGQPTAGGKSLSGVGLSRPHPRTRRKAPARRSWRTRLGPPSIRHRGDTARGPEDAVASSEKGLIFLMSITFLHLSVNMSKEWTSWYIFRFWWWAISDRRSSQCSFPLLEAVKEPAGTGSGSRCVIYYAAEAQTAACLLTWVSAFDLLVQFTVVFY